VNVATKTVVKLNSGFRFGDRSVGEGEEN